ncbi:MAG: hypothetical protein Q9159_005967 [Coniocarpon cinnabarinum]
MLNDYKPTNDPNIDTFKVEYLLGASAVLAVLVPNRFLYSPTEILWTFSIWLESVAILPQLFMLQRTGEAETITTHYLFALGIYRAFYILNWIWRFFTDTKNSLEPIAVIAGILQTVLYSDFFYIYYVKVLQGKKFNLPVGGLPSTQFSSTQHPEMQTPSTFMRNFKLGMPPTPVQSPIQQPRKRECCGSYRGAELEPGTCARLTSDTDM